MGEAFRQSRSIAGAARRPSARPRAHRRGATRGPRSEGLGRLRPRQFSGLRQSRRRKHAACVALQKQRSRDSVQDVVQSND